MSDAHSNPETARRRPPAAPLFAATVCFSSGILLQTYVNKPAALYFLCTLGFALCSLVSLRLARNNRALIGYVAAILAFFPAGALLTCAQGSRSAPVPTILQYAGGDEVTLTGYVVRESSRRAGRDPRESLDFAVEEAQFDDQAPQPVTGTARLNIYVPGSRFAWQSDEEEPDESEAAALPELDYGQRLRIRAKLRPPVNFRNPGNMDYVGWLRGQGVAVIGSAKSTNIDILTGLGGTPFERLRWHARRSVLRHMEHLWPAPYAGLFQAMVLGERGLVTHEQRLEFQRSGTFHLLVVSGMNVAIFAVFLLWLMRWLRLPAEYAIVATIVLTCGYAWLTDLGAPILRSVIMIVAYQIAALLNRDRAPLNTVSLAALALLVCDPNALFDASFQLTFLAVLTIAGIGVPLFSRTTTPMREALDDIANQHRDLTLRPRQAQFRLDLRAIASKLGYLIGTRPALWLLSKLIYLLIAVAELAALSALMQAALTLPTVWYFHRINPHAVWANMAVLPLTSLLMPTSMLAVAFSYLAGWLASPFAIAARWALQGILLTVHWSGGAQITDLRVAMPAMAAISAVALAYAVALLLSRRHWLLAFTSFGLLAASAFTVFQHPRPFAYQPHELEITAIDIGQGDSFLLVTPSGHTLLLDSGGLLGHSELDIGEDVVSPYLWQRGLSRLDAVAFSHGHSDHMGGMTAILRNFRPGEMWYAPNYPSHEIESLIATADRLRVRRIERHFGDRFDFDGVHFEVLSPPPDWELKPRGQDDASLVLRLTYAGHTALLMGDIHKRMEKILVEEAESKHRSLHADLLKVAHHGSNTSSCDELLDAVRPQYAVISAGIRNPFRHPRPEVIERLASHRARIYRTDLFGPITFYMDAAGVHPVVAR